MGVWVWSSGQRCLGLKCLRTKTKKNEDEQEKKEMWKNEKKMQSKTQKRIEKKKKRERRKQEKEQTPSVRLSSSANFDFRQFVLDRCSTLGLFLRGWLIVANFHPPLFFRQKWRARQLPRLAWEVQPKVNGLPRSLLLLRPLELRAELAPSLHARSLSTPTCDQIRSQL